MPAAIGYVFMLDADTVLLGMGIVIKNEQTRKLAATEKGCFVILMHSQHTHCQ